MVQKWELIANRQENALDLLIMLLGKDSSDMEVRICSVHGPEEHNTVPSEASFFLPIPIWKALHGGSFQTAIQFSMINLIL